MPEPDKWAIYVNMIEVYTGSLLSPTRLADLMDEPATSGKKFLFVWKNKFLNLLNPYILDSGTASLR